ncbi:MAG: hypothetical protein COV01_02535 [Candidatus Taylorbacteria bacterium CG10_big_fil_rev_8_21_14_0_10_41_48]|uniref:J domain-containing protein n=1 Tax=Candidatus Taylorbacteria bacterium CG10_big_fil_rev_8_21_14_0_10_41_48 TaxID=1975024 RepID=A0A2M8LCR9_9BACT|nr:MAG: hypothetical protein COV01_02535 [Candidatus Taylorbacteria bacterium CG10_big_fil_rev_8_21_14_0_10_41_48]
MSFLKRTLFLSTAIIIIVGGGVYYWKTQYSGTQKYLTPEEENSFVRFDMEAYDSILTNYWMPHDQYNLPEIFKLSLQKMTGTEQNLATSTRSAVSKMLGKVISATTTEGAKNISLNTLAVVLYNLQPINRNGILSSSQVQDLRQNVANVNPANDLYKNLGIERGSNLEAVNNAYDEKVAVLKNATTSEAQAELAQIEYAHQVLSNEMSRQLYDTNQIEPTLFSRVLNKTLYLHMSKISPTTLQEFVVAVDTASTTAGLNSMIIDLRGNLGGALDFTQNFLGLFIGNNQYAFDLFRQGDFNAQRTVQPKFPELDRFKEIAILTDGLTQSTAELTASALRRFRIAYIVGEKTRGWGTVENTYPLETVIDPETSYSLLLVNNLTLGVDNQPIEQNSVTPDILTTEKNWQSNLSYFFSSPSLIQTLSGEKIKSPLK